MDAADDAVTAMLSSHDYPRVLDVIRPFAGRDFAVIGHKAINVTNATRLLQRLGTGFSEPLLRVVVRDLLNPTRHGNSGYDHLDRQSYLLHRERWEGFSDAATGWMLEEHDEAATMDLLSTLRDGDGDAATLAIVARLREGKPYATAIWDAVHLAAAELMINRPDLIGLHANTSAHALHAAYLDTVSPAVRLELIMQAVCWVCDFRRLMQPLPGSDLLALTAVQPPASVSEALPAIRNAESYEHASALALGFCEAYPAAIPALLADMRHKVCLKSLNVNAFKFVAAMIEVVAMVSACWQPRIIAALMYRKHGDELADSCVAEQVRASGL